MADRINIAAELERSIANGPGKRYVIWLQGCPLRCTGCCNPAFQSLTVNKLVAPEAVAQRVLSIRDITGITYSGGEPMIQAKPLSSLSAILHKEGLSIVCYSGFTLEELYKMNDPSILELLSLIDILIDGRYEEDKRANLPWRGSYNQRVHLLSNRYSSYRREIESCSAQTEIVISDAGMVLTGNVQGEIMNRLQKMIGVG